MFKIAVLPGDGIGQEVIPQAVKVLQAVAEKYGHDFKFEEGLIGGTALDAVGSSLPPETLELCMTSDAVLFGAFGGPQWDNDPRMREGSLLTLRKKLGVFANLRPVVLYKSLINTSPVKPQLLNGTDILVVRELTGGLYFGDKQLAPEKAVDTMVYYVSEIERIGRVAFEAARLRRGKVTSVDKANVLACSRLWRQVINRLAGEYPDVSVEHMYVDNCAMQIIREPRQFDTIVTENTFGDILSDEASVLIGSLGMLPSASIGGKVGLYEPVHGSAPDIAGQNIANPLAAILSAALMLRYSFKLLKEAKAVEEVVGRVLDHGYRTRDIMEPGKVLVGTLEMGELVAKELLRD